MWNIQKINIQALCSLRLGFSILNPSKVGKRNTKSETRCVFVGKTMSPDYPRMKNRVCK